MLVTARLIGIGGSALSVVGRFNRLVIAHVPRTSLSLLRPFDALPPPLAGILFLFRNARHGGNSGAQRGLLEINNLFKQAGVEHLVQKHGLWGKGRRGLVMLVGQKRSRDKGMQQGSVEGGCHAWGGWSPFF